MATQNQYPCLENLMDRGAWRATVHAVAKSQTQLNEHTHTHTHSLSLSHTHTHTHTHTQVLSPAVSGFLVKPRRTLIR